MRVTALKDDSSNIAMQELNDDSSKIAMHIVRDGVQTAVAVMAYRRVLVVEDGVGS